MILTKSAIDEMLGAYCNAPGGSQAGWRAAAKTILKRYGVEVVDEGGDPAVQAVIAALGPAWCTEDQAKGLVRIIDDARKGVAA